MWKPNSNPFQGWGVEVVYEKDRATHDARCHKDVKKKIFLVQLGLKEEEWEGLFFPVKDLPYLEEHELNHAFGLTEGTDELFMNPLFAYPHELPDIMRAELRNEKRAWAGLLGGYLPLEVLEKIQLFFTDYIFIFDDRLKKQGQKGLVDE